MTRGIRRLAAALSLLLGLGAAALRSADPPALTAHDLAQKVVVSTEAGPALRYNQGLGPYPPSTQTLLERPQAFHPGQKVHLSFRPPRDARLEGALELRAVFALHDLDGRKVQDAGEVTLRAQGSEVGGTLEWTVPDAKEGSYFLAARFLDAEGNLLLARSDVVFVAPDYERRLAEAKGVAVDASRLPPLLREVSLPSTQLLVEDAQARFRDFSRAPRDWEFVKRQLETARDYSRRLAAGEDPYKDKTGVFVKAYRSEADDTLQPYALYVPRSYDPRKRWPLLVGLHGAFSSHLLNRRRVFGLGNRPGESDYEAVRNEDVTFPDVDFIVLNPFGRGEVAGYNGLAEQDVLRAMADVERAYSIDEDRVYLTGLSMGGGGTWHLGLRYPDRFAAIVPVCAVGDYTLFPGGRELTGDSRRLLELSGPSAIAENAAHLQVFMYHGDEDPAVDVEQSRQIAARFRELKLLGTSAQLFELPGVNHFAWDFAYRNASIFERLADIRRDPSPPRVVYSTFSPRYNQAYWLRIDRIERGFRLARIEGVRGAGAIDVSVENVSAFTILLEEARVEQGRPFEVKVNGQTAWHGDLRGAKLSLSRDREERWREKPWVGPALGPPDHPEAAFVGGSLAQRDAHFYVYGTSGDDATKAAAKQAAERLADWGPNVRSRFKVLADTEVTPQVLAERSLVLVGNAVANRFVARVADRLPLRQDGTGTFAGTKRVAGAGARYRLACPSPLGPGHYLLIYGGGNAEAIQALLPPMGQRPPPVQPDYVVMGEDGKSLLEGYFKDSWKIE
jgi:pimeloyl-ACP methyl ester carboxylesterase